MSSQRIIYPSGDPDADGNVPIAVIIPAPEALAEFGIEAIAQKDVPAGLPYAIVDVSEIPSDRTFRAAWEINKALLDDGVGAEASTFEDLK